MHDGTGGRITPQSYECRNLGRSTAHCPPSTPLSGPTARSRNACGFTATALCYDFSHIRVHTRMASLMLRRGGRTQLVAMSCSHPGNMHPRRRKVSSCSHMSLPYVVQQQKRSSRQILMRQPAPARQLQVHQANVQEAAEFLEDMARFIEGAGPLRSQCHAVDAAGACDSGSVQASARRADQQRLLQKTARNAGGQGSSLAQASACRTEAEHLVARCATESS